MRTIIVFVCLVLTTSLAFSQGMIGYNKRATRKALEKYNKEHHFTNSSIRTEPYLISLEVRDSTVSPVTFNYLFDKSGKCHTEQKITSCEICYKNLMDNLLGKQKYAWVKVNDSLYVSKYSKKRMITLSVENNYRHIEVSKASWTKAAYARLLTGKQ